MEQPFTSFNDNTIGPIMDLGLTDYAAVRQKQLALALSVALKKQEELIIITEHFPVYTCGRGTKPHERPVGSDIPVVDIERGGGLTYHGPGQLVGYPILNLNRRKMSIPQYLRKLENILIETLEEVGVSGAAYRKECLAGVWVGDLKIASIGIAVRRWVTFHGFALNMDVDMEPFKNAQPCGMSGNKMTSLKELGYNIPQEKIHSLVTEKLLQVFCQ